MSRRSAMSSSPARHGMAKERAALPEQMQEKPLAKSRRIGEARIANSFSEPARSTSSPHQMRGRWQEATNKISARGSIAAGFEV